MSNLSKTYFHNEEAAYESVESKVWPNGSCCPRRKYNDRITKMQGKYTRIKPATFSKKK